MQLPSAIESSFITAFEPKYNRDKSQQKGYTPIRFKNPLNFNAVANILLNNQSNIVEQQQQQKQRKPSKYYSAVCLKCPVRKVINAGGVKLHFSRMHKDIILPTKYSQSNNSKHK